VNPPLAIALALGIAATVEDLRRRTLPNWLTVSGLAAGLVLSTRDGWHGLWPAAAGAAAGFAILLPLFWLRGLGGGDIKLMAAFGALLGPAGVLTAACFASLFGAALAAVAVAVRPRAAAIPYAPAIALGALLSLVGGSA